MNRTDSATSVSELVYLHSPWELNNFSLLEDHSISTFLNFVIKFISLFVSSGIFKLLIASKTWFSFDIILISFISFS